MKEPESRWPFDSPEHRLIEKYIRVTRLHRSVIEHRLEGTGVYRSQHQILMFASHNPNVSQKDLAEMYGVSGATMAVSLKKLEKGGYINRLVDQHDNRCNQICITEKGRKVVEESVLIFQRLERCMFERFSEHDMDVLGNLLDRIYGNLDQDLKDGPIEPEHGPIEAGHNPIETEREEN